MAGMSELLSVGQAAALRWPSTDAVGYQRFLRWAERADMPALRREIERMTRICRQEGYRLDGAAAQEDLARIFEGNVDDVDAIIMKWGRDYAIAVSEAK